MLGKDKHGQELLRPSSCQRLCCQVLLQVLVCKHLDGGAAAAVADLPNEYMRSPVHGCGANGVFVWMRGIWELALVFMGQLPNGVVLLLLG